jgi:hypothetical protein
MPLYDAIINSRKDVVKILILNQASLGLIDLEVTVFLNQIVASNDLELV